MNKAFRYFLSAIAIFSLLLGSMAMAPAAHSNAPVYLKGGLFVPAKNQFNTGSQKYFIVQFVGPIQQPWKDAVTSDGAEILEYIPDFAFKVRMNPAIAKHVERYSFVNAVAAYQPAFKLGTNIKRDYETHLYQVRLEKGSDYGIVRSLVARTGAEVLGFDGDILVIAANGGVVDAIAQVDDVASITNFYRNEKLSTSNLPALNEAARDIIGATIADSRGYDGSTQIAAVSDTGIGGGTPTTAHPDIPSSRVVAIYNWPGMAGGCIASITNDGAVDRDSGHGTHTSGSVLSDGGPGGIGMGVAPAARLVFQALENWTTTNFICQYYYGWPANSYSLIGLPTDLNTLFQEAYNAGARVHSNSWGAAVAGDYNTNSLNADMFMWNNRDMLITFSAGNSGVDANSDGVVDSDSIGSPATAKNVLTVGASENQRTDNYPCDASLTYTSHDAYQTGQTCASMGGNQGNYLGTYGQRYPASFPVNPIFSDLSAGNWQQMAPWSSRGPTDDTRIKPDVVAPGSWILSAYSSLYQEGYGDPVNPQNSWYQWDGWGLPYNSEYKYVGGTSMSNPIAAGGATVIRDYYNKAKGINASAALVKATMINSAVDLLDENNDGVNDNDYPIPNNHEGWGLVNLDGATDGTIQFVDEGTGLSTGGSAIFQVTSSGGPLKVTIVWTDYPSTDTASINLVNDLDLTVTGPSSTFRGNVFSGGWSTTGGTADRRNNVENVYIQNTAAGTYTVTINGYNVPTGPQKFALVVDGGTLGTGPTNTPTLTYTPTTTNTPTNTPTTTYTPTASFTSTSTNTPTATYTPTTTNTPTNTPSPTYTPTTTYTPTATFTFTPTNTPAPTTSTGFLSPSANAAVTSSSGDNNGYQTSPANAYVNDSLFAVDTNSGTGTSTAYTGTQKDRHLFYNYGFNIPTGAVIKGIQVRLDAKADATSGSPQIYVELSWDGGVTWTTALATVNLTKSEVTYTLGGTANTWGRIWSAADFTNANFRVRVVDVASNTSRDFSLDYISVNVTYQP